MMQSHKNKYDAETSPFKNDFDGFRNIIEDLPSAIKTKMQLSNIFRSIHQKMNEGLPYIDILNDIFEPLDTVIPFDRLGIALLDPSEQTISLRWVKSKMPIKKLKKDYFADLNVKSSLLNIIQTGQPRIINDLVEYFALHPNSKSTELALDDGIRSSLTCPLKVEGRPIGVIFFSSATPHTYEPSHISLFSELAEGLAIIIEKDLLKKSNLESQSREAFLKQTIHDLNNSLQIIAGTVELLNKKQSKVAEKEIQRSLSILSKNCDTMKRKMHELVYDESRKSTDESFDLNNFVSELYYESNLIAKNKNMKVKFEKSPGLPNELHSNFTDIKNSAENLIFNAIKFSPQETEIIVRFDFDKPEHRLFVTVTDKGPGIPTEEQDELFKLHGKTSIRPTSDEPSSGTGLWNVKNSIERDGGQVFFHSEVGIGSTFGFWIPCSN